MRKNPVVVMAMVLGLIVASSFIAGKAFATLDELKIIKGVYPGKAKYSCQICHVEKLPKKDSHILNDYGKKALDAAGGAGHKPTAEDFKKVGDPDAAK